MLKGLNDFLDKHEGRPVGSSTLAIKKERIRQGYDKTTKSKALDKFKKFKGVIKQLKPCPECGKTNVHTHQ